MFNVSFFYNLTTPVHTFDIYELANKFKTEEFKNIIESLRCEVAKQNIKEVEKIKKSLPAFTPSATFNKRRVLKNLLNHSQIIHLDYDKIPGELYDTVFDKITQCAYTAIAFKSPSGNGIKVFIKSNVAIDNHNELYLQIQSYYDHLLGIQSDNKCKDITRLCFISYDPKTYINRESKFFDRIEKGSEDILDNPIDSSSLFEQQMEFTNRITHYYDGNRNNYIYQLASNCNRAGINEIQCISFISQYFNDLSFTEMQSTVQSAYHHHSYEFAKYAKHTKLQSSQKSFQKENSEIEDALKTTPTIPSDIIDSLPNLFRDGCLAFNDYERKRDVFLTAALTIVSGCLPDVTGVYHQDRVYPQLFSFIIAPAASGKGVLKNAKRLGDKIHERFQYFTKEAKIRYESEIALYKKKLSIKQNQDTVLEKPIEPKLQLLFIPADTSQAMMIKMLQDNDGKGIICETEADAMSGANKQDWGNYSHILRGAFHNEKISAARKTNLELLEISNPQLAICLSGTPAQVPKLISSSEDGLFSRFLFYAFKSELLWQDPSPKPNGVIFSEHFEELSNELLRIYDFLLINSTEVKLTPNQWEILNSSFSQLLSETVLYNNEDTAGIVFRLGLILYRLCMIFTALRKVENGDCSNHIICTDEDFNSALELVKIYLNHSLLMFNNLANQSEPIAYKSSNNKKAFFEALPNTFQRKEAIEIGRKWSLSDRSIDSFLKNAIPTLLSKTKAGWYEKVGYINHI